MSANKATIFNIVLGTAGHIDHGKSSLVQRLTGIDPDRLPEEKARGLTIDLGFAPWNLPDGRRVGVVDVPGHERLIKNMVAGATGIDLVLLVVASDDGVMPQTREHITIMQILGLRHGVIAMTKADLVDDDLRELVREEIAETVAGTFLEDAPIVEVSSITGAGFEELTTTLLEAMAKVEPRDSTGVFRMPIQRVFSSRGFGTVVTGIPVSGTTRVGATLEILPLGRKARIRGLQAYKETTEEAHAGHSTAINLSDVDHHEVTRGMVVAEPGYFQASRMFEARLHYRPASPRPLLHQTTVRIHTGTTEAIGELYLLESKSLAPGGEAFVQFRLHEPIVAAPGDRFVLRLHSPMETIGGGFIVDRSRWRLKTGKEFVLGQLDAKSRAIGDSHRTIVQTLISAGFDVATERDLARRIGADPKEARAIIDALVADGEIREASRGGNFYAVTTFEEALVRARQIADRFFAANPRRRLMEKSYLKRELGAGEVFLTDLLARLTEDGEIEAAPTGGLSWRDGGPRLTDEDRAVRDEIADVVGSRAFSPPSPEETATEFGRDLTQSTELFELLVEEGELVKLADGIYFHRDALARARELLRAWLLEHGSMSASDARSVLDSSRKYSIPLLEKLDRDGFTARKGDLRTLREKT